MREALSLCVVRHGFRPFKYISYFLHMLGIVEFVEGEEGDGPSRLSIDSSVVRERRVRYLLFVHLRWLTSV